LFNVKWIFNAFRMLINNNYLSFKVYDQFNKELCLIVVNVDTSEEMYCHVKTTPEMPVRLAVRMSMSFPGTFIIYMVQIYIYPLLGTPMEIIKKLMS
jgi:arachidonate 5-lipoxygenase